MRFYGAVGTFRGHEAGEERLLPGARPRMKSRSSPSPIVPRLALSPDEAAAALGVSRDFFDEHIRHELRLIYRGRRRLVSVRELERWLAESAHLAA